MITSIRSSHIKNVNQLEKKKKARSAAQAFVSEGIRMVLETPIEMLRSLYISESFYSDAEKRSEAEEYFSDVVGSLMKAQDAFRQLPSQDMVRMGSTEVYLVSDEVMGRMADTEHPQGILAVTSMPKYSFEDLLYGSWHGEMKNFDSKDTAEETTPLLLIPEDVQDPGNLGTMFRTAEGAGVTGIILSPGCADPFQPKVVRATMGSLFRMPFYQVESMEDWYPTLEKLQAEGISLYAAWLDGSVPYDEPVYISPSGFLIGNEGNGLKKETAELADQRIRIPMGGQLESLNAAMSAGILMYEANRQRRNQ